MGDVEVPPLRGDAPTLYADAVEAYLTSAGIAASSRRIYRISLTTWVWLARGEQAPLGTPRGIAVVPGLALAALDRPDAPEVLAKSFAHRVELVDADTSTGSCRCWGRPSWWRGRGWIAANPIAGIQRRPAPPDRTKALAHDQITKLFAVKANRALIHRDPGVRRGAGAGLSGELRHRSYSWRRPI